MKKTIFLLAFTLLYSCKVQEKIVPFTDSQTIAQSQGRDPILTVFKGNIEIDDYDIQRPVQLPIGIVGPLLEGIANVFANIFVSIGENGSVDQDPIFFEIPLIDEETVSSLNITSILFNIKKDSPKSSGVDFIERLDIYIANERMMETKERILLASYRYNKARLKACKKKCLTLNLKKTPRGIHFNLAPVLANSNRIFIIPKLEIKKVPNKSFKMKGTIDYKMSVNLPF